MNTKKAIVMAIVVSIASASCLAANAESAISLNNKGVQLLNDKQYDASMVNFIAALKVDPKYKLALVNLSIAHNNRGLEIAKISRDRAIPEFYKAYYLQRDTATRQNLDACLRSQGTELKTSADRLKMSDALLTHNDIEAALVELEMAYQISKDNEVLKKIDVLLKKLKSTGGHLPPNISNSSELITKVETGHGAPLTPVTTSNSEIDQYQQRIKSDPKALAAALAYLPKIQKQIKNAWHPEGLGHLNPHVIRAYTNTSFHVLADGTLRDAKIIQSCGDKEIDDAALSALASTSPVERPPAELKTPVPIEFDFTINRGTKSERNIQNTGIISSSKKGLNNSITSSSSNTPWTVADAEGRKLYALKNYAGAEAFYKVAYDLALKQTSVTKILASCINLHSAIWRRSPKDALALYKSQIELAHKNISTSESQQFIFEYASELDAAKQFPESLEMFKDGFEAYKATHSLNKAKAKAFLEEYAGLLRKQQKVQDADALEAWMKTQSWT